MPAKRRYAKRRFLTPEAEVRAWSMTFKSGHDYLNDLGFGYGNAEARNRAGPAWDRLGLQFLALNPSIADPWALGAFGYPKGGAKCR